MIVGTSHLDCSQVALSKNNKNIFKGVTLHLLARIIAWLPAPAEIE
jgi:hypothetical protein